MARSISEIQAAIISDVQAQPELAAANSTSKRAIWRLWTFVVAVAINLLEQLMDIFTSNTEATVALSAPQTPQWLQDKVLNFQYDATNPQVLKLINFVPQYEVVNTSLKIITRCSVKTTLANKVQIKVAKSEPPDALTTSELNALQSYVNILGVSGINYVVSSSPSDKLFIDADIYYTGSYSSVIKDNVIAAIGMFLASLPFDGSLKLLDLEIAIRKVSGINDVVFKNVRTRQNSTPLSSASYLVQSNTVVSRLWPTVSGYIVSETTSGNTLADTLNFIPE